MTKLNWWIQRDGIYFCAHCMNEAYWDTDYGQQLFDYCPYCGNKMEQLIDETRIYGGKNENKKN